MHVALHICLFLNSCQGFSSAFNGCHISIIQGTTTFAISTSTLWFPCEYLICLYETQGTFETNKDVEEDDIQTDRQSIRRMALVCPMSASLGPCPGASIVYWCRGRVGFLVRCHCALSESLPVSTIEWSGTMPTRTSALCQSLLEPPPPEKGQVTGLAVLWKLLWKKFLTSGPLRQVVMSIMLIIPCTFWHTHYALFTSAAAVCWPPSNCS